MSAFLHFHNIVCHCTRCCLHSSLNDSIGKLLPSFCLESTRDTSLWFLVVLFPFYFKVIYIVLHLIWVHWSCVSSDVLNVLNRSTTATHMYIKAKNTSICGSFFQCMCYVISLTHLCVCVCMCVCVCEWDLVTWQTILLFSRDIANAIRNLLDAVNNIFVYIEGQSNKQVTPAFFTLWLIIRWHQTSLVLK